VTQSMPSMAGREPASVRRTKRALQSATDALTKRKFPITWHSVYVQGFITGLVVGAGGVLLLALALYHATSNVPF